MNQAVVAIIGLAGTIAAYVLAYDLTAGAQGWPTISAQLHTWLQAQISGPVVAGAWFGISVGLAYHFLINR